jgi:Na+-driven multidrug efflux pump
VSRKRKILASALAGGPGVLGALVGDTSLKGLALATADVTILAILVSRNVTRGQSRRAHPWLDLACWWSAAFSLVVSVLLSSPAPEFFASVTPGRRIVLALAGFVACASVAIVLRDPPGEQARDE